MRRARRWPTAAFPKARSPDVKADLATIARGAELRADVVVDMPREAAIAGRSLSFRIARRAATERDLWIYDAAEKRAIVGDLVTVPVPFLDTACPEGWLKALDDIASSGAQTGRSRAWPPDGDRRVQRLASRLWRFYRLRAGVRRA
jgi:hypothetical protein